MFDAEYIISLYFNGDEALGQADIDKLSDWIGQSHENAAKFVQASFVHRIIHDCLTGEDIQKNVLLDLQEAIVGDYEVLMDSNAALKGVDVQDILSDKKDAAVGDYDVCQDSSFIQAIQELAESEKTASGVIVEEQAGEPDERESFLSGYHPRKPLSARQWCRFAIKAGCITMICASLLWLDRWLMRPRDARPIPVVAQLVDEIDAVWDETMEFPYDDGQMLQGSYRLTGGFVDIRCESGAKITVEAPAKWSLQGGDNMELFEGRIYAVIGEEARGFTVNAGNTKIVDRGTEFGVEVDKYNNTQLHVTKGRTILFYGLKKGRKLERYVSEGMAVLTDNTGKLRNIKLALKKFARGIDSVTGKITGLLEDIPPTYIPIANAGFQIPDQGEDWAYNPIDAVWAFTGGSGLAGSDNWEWRCRSISPDPFGGQFAFLQGAAAISQEMTGLSAGSTYEISFFEAARTWYYETKPYPYGNKNDLSVILDEGLPAEVVIYNNSEVDNIEWKARTTSQFVAAKASYTLTFRTTNSPDNEDCTTLIDGVRVMAIDP